MSFHSHTFHVPSLNAAYWNVMRLGIVMRENQIVLLNGTSSAGKSSIAKQLQVLSGCTLAHMHIDMYLEVFNFRHLRDKETRLNIVNTAIDLFHASIANVCEKPFPLVVDTVFQEHCRYEELVKIFADRNVCFVGVRCEKDEAIKRERERGNRPIGLVEFQYDLVHENKPYNIEVDTSNSSAEECAAEILSFLNNSEVSGVNA